MAYCGAWPAVWGASISLTPAQQAVLKDKLLSTGDPADAAPAPVTLHPDHLQQLPNSVLADLQLRSQLMRLSHRDVALRLADDEEEAQKALVFLWQHAVERSSAIRYAVQKLGERSHPDQSAARATNTKKLLQTLAQVGGAAGSLWMGNPLGVLTGSMVNQVVNDFGGPSAKKVTDADMVVLTKAVENLQQEVMTAYFNYRFTTQRLALLEDANRELLPYYNQAMRNYTHAKTTDAQAVQALLQSQWQQWQQTQQWVKQQSQQSQAALALLVGQEAVTALTTLSQQAQATVEIPQQG